MPYEKPQVEKIEKKDYVFDEFHKAGFKIEEFPEIFERAVELANMPDSHFDDGVKMSQIIELEYLTLVPIINSKEDVFLVEDDEKLADISIRYRLIPGITWSEGESSLGKNFVVIS